MSLLQILLVFDSFGLGWGLRFGISNKLQVVWMLLA